MDAPMTERVSAPDPLRVLVVDDDPVSRLVLKASVERLGHACSVAEDGVRRFRSSSVSARRR